MYNPGRGWVYMCVAGSGGGTRYARLPPVIEIIPLIGVSLMLYAKKTKRHPCHSLTTGYRGYTPFGVSLPPIHRPLHTSPTYSSLHTTSLPHTDTDSPVCSCRRDYPKIYTGVYSLWETSTRDVTTTPTGVTPR